MAYLIDSDVVIYHLIASSSTGSSVENLLDEGIAMSSITLMEVFEGIEKSPDPTFARSRFNALLAVIPVIPFGEAEALQCAEIRL